MPFPSPMRDYSGLLARHGLDPACPLPAADREQTMRRAMDLLWGGVGSLGISWIGFYTKVPDADEMILTCREPKAACSPIGLFGMCGRGWKERKPILIADVRTLGKDYIACDPKDQSELVIPLISPDGSCDAVLDADSYELNLFSQNDITGMTCLLVALGLTTPASIDLPVLHL